MPLDHILVKGAREHNLKNITVRIPRDKMVVITGLSGSGKSTLAFDTIYAEGQRRYVESLSAYARQFLGQMEKPDVDIIEGLSPAVSIDQKGATRNPRSTVGTVTEIYDHLRLLFARVGVPHCPTHGIPIVAQHVQEIVDQISAYPDGTRLLILAPLVRDRKGEHQQLFATARRGGYARVRVDGTVRDLTEDITLDKMRKHTVEVVVDRLVVRKGVEAEEERSRLSDSVETALRLGEGLAVVADADGKVPERMFSERLACPEGDFSIGEIEPRTFSFNSPHGACPSCTGLGTRLEPDPDLILANPDLSLANGAILPWHKTGGTAAYRMAALGGLAKKMKFSLDTKVKDLSEKAREAILSGVEDKLHLSYATKSGVKRQYDIEWEGVVPWLERHYRETTSEYIKQDIERYMSERPCPTCKGSPAARDPRGHDRRQEHRRREPALRRRDGRLVHLDREGARRTAVGPQPKDREAGAEGDPHPPRLPRRRRSGLPHRRSGGDDAVRWRGAAHPPRDTDRIGPHGRAVHPRRAVDRPASAGQRPAHPDAHRDAGHRQHRHRRRARRGDHPQRRPRHRHRPRSRRARR